MELIWIQKAYQFHIVMKKMWLNRCCSTSSPLDSIFDKDRNIPRSKITFKSIPKFKRFKSISLIDFFSFFTKKYFINWFLIVLWIGLIDHLVVNLNKWLIICLKFVDSIISVVTLSRQANQYILSLSRNFSRTNNNIKYLVSSIKVASTIG